MASILRIGERWRAQIRREGKSIAKTFRTKAQAEAWARETEHAMENGGGLDIVSGRTLVPALITKYREMRAASGRPIRDKSTEHYQLIMLSDAFNLTLRDLSTKNIVKFAQDRAAAGAGPATVGMDVSKFGTVLRHMASFMDFDMVDVVAKARPILHHLHLIGSAKARDRRPLLEELAKIREWCVENPQFTLPLMDIIEINGQSAFRRSEVFGLRWADIDTVRRTALVRDRKDPRKKKGNDVWVPLIGTSLDVILRQPRISGEPRVFPYSPQTASKYFKAACDAKGIVDLKLHDLRHEATSALFEAGWEIPEVAGVTGHKDWRNLKRYTNLRPESLAEKGKLLPFKKSA